MKYQVKLLSLAIVFCSFCVLLPEVWPLSHFPMFRGSVKLGQLPFYDISFSDHKGTNHSFACSSSTSLNEIIRSITYYEVSRGHINNNEFFRRALDFCKDEVKEKKLERILISKKNIVKMGIEQFQKSEMPIMEKAISSLEKND